MVQFKEISDQRDGIMDFRAIWRRFHLAQTLLLCALLMGVSGCADPTATISTPGGPAVALPHFDHIVVVMEENHSYGEIVGAGDAPYINSLLAQSAVFTDSHGIGHPSQPNYLALFAGSTFGVTSDDCPQRFTAPNLGAELLAQQMTFTGYSESMPSAGFTGCEADNANYARKHNPWVNFAHVPAESNQPFDNFPTDFTQLPTVAFVVPNQQDDMHSGSIAAGDSWLKDQMDAYAQWAPAHNSLLVLTWDEDDGSDTNQILTLMLGAHVKAGRYAETINHYNVLRTIEALNGLPYTGNAANATTIADVWQG